MKCLAERIVIWLIKSGTIPKEDRELYEYAAYSLILSISPVIMIMLIGSLMGKLVEGILIIAPFMFIRKFSGGFHAKYAWECMLFSNGILFICVYIAAHIRYSVLIDIVMLCAIASLIIFSPIDSENRRLDLSEKKKYKITTTIMVLVFVIIYCLFLIVGYTTYAVCIAEGLVLTACLQVPCVLDKLGRQVANKIMSQTTKQKWAGRKNLCE